MKSLGFVGLRLLRLPPFRRIFAAHVDRCAAYFVFSKIDLGASAPDLNLSHIFGVKPLPDLRTGEFDVNGERIEGALTGNDALGGGKTPVIQYIGGGKNTLQTVH